MSNYRLSDICSCGNWEQFCEEKGFNVYAVNEGGGDVEVYLEDDEAVRYGLLDALRAKVAELEENEARMREALEECAGRFNLVDDWAGEAIARAALEVKP